MAEIDFFCNFKDCRKPLLSTAWITKCSHIFCEEHGSTISHNQVCPACKSNLPGNIDATLQNLNPSEAFRSMILTGLKPEVMIDIIARSMAFRTYQMVQERAFYNTTINSLHAQLTQQESEHKSEITKMQNDFLVETKKQQVLLKELESQKFRIQEYERLLTERNRQIQTMQMKYESLRCQNTYQNLQSPSFGQPTQKGFGYSQNEAINKNYMTQENFLQGQNLQNTHHQMKSTDFSDFQVTFKRSKRTSPLHHLFQEKDE